MLVLYLFYWRIWYLFITAIGDGAYDNNNNFQFLSFRGINPAIKVRKNSRCTNTNHYLRNKAVTMQKTNLQQWKDSVDYGQRWIEYYHDRKHGLTEIHNRYSANGTLEEYRSEARDMNMSIVLSHDICYTLLLAKSKECCYIRCSINKPIDILK